jgi:ADP-ribose pyrophosphatase
MKINTVRKLTDVPHLNLFAVGYTDKNHCSREWQIVSRCDNPKLVAGDFQRPDAVVIVPMHEETGKLVIIKEFRVPLGGYQYGFPAGLIDGDETIPAAAERELREETGLDITRIDRISPPVYSSSGMSDESVSLVYASCSGSPSSQYTEASEDITTLLMSPPEAAALCRVPDLKFDVKTWMILSAYAIHGTV